MKTRMMLIAMCAGVGLAAQAFAAPPAGAPAGTTGTCKDGSYWSGATKKGACKGHKGVQDWYAADASATAPAAATPAAAKPAAAPTAPAAPAAAAAKPAAAPTAPAAPAATTTPAVKPAATTTTTTTKAATTTKEAAPGGGPDKVWVNTKSKVYHCPGTKNYGTTKAGEYMTEAAAIAAGDHADHGKACH